MNFAKRCNKLEVFLQVSTGKICLNKRRLSTGVKLHNVLSQIIFCIFIYLIIAYVNGQRKGKILETPFCINDDTIVRENLGGKENPPDSIPKLDVESEICLAEDRQRGLAAHSVAQAMKELGLDR